MKIRITFILALVLSLCESMLFAHDRPVHEAITAHAEASLFDYPSAYVPFLNTILTDCDRQEAIKYMIIGSDQEDNIFKDDGGARSLNHFYDPLTGLGLSNIPYDDRPTSGTIGIDSFTWGSKRNSPGKTDVYNIWSWQNARDKEWLGITAITPSNRRAALLEMFRGVGQVVHLLEDASQPEHTRNEQHLFPGSPIEKYGGENLTTLNYQHGMLDWRNKGFTKLKDFWDRNLYHGDGTALDEDAGGGAKLGMAEFSNGNFLGGRHLYSEYFAPGDVQYYPRPSRDKSTNYEQVRADPSIGLETYTLENGHEAKGIYIKKNRNGVTVNHLSRINYLGAKQFSGLSGKAFCTIDDQNVLSDYHSILIPKAVEYSAGVLDYFFRGQIEITATIESPSQIKLHVINKSEQTMQGGTFSVYGDDNSENRSLVQTFNNTTLPNNAAVDLTFTRSASAVKYLLVYKGTIGVDTANQPLDPVDKEIAIAVKSFKVLDYAWWKMDEASGDRIDSVHGFALSPYTWNTGSSISSVSGKISGAANLSAISTSTYESATLFGAGGLPHVSGDDITLAGWFKYTGTVSGNGLQIGWHTGNNYDYLFASNFDPGNLFELFSPFNSLNGLGIVPPPSSDTWHFLVLEYDAAGGELRVELDRNGLIYSQAASAIPTTVILPYFSRYNNIPSEAGGDLTLDEMGLFLKLLTASEKDYLYNGGNGRTSPIVFP